MDGFTRENLAAQNTQKLAVNTNMGLLPEARHRLNAALCSIHAALVMDSNKDARLLQASSISGQLSSAVNELEIVADYCRRTVAAMKLEPKVPIKEHEAALLSAAIRLQVGITGKSTPNCECYQGLKFDAMNEMRKALTARD